MIKMNSRLLIHTPVKFNIGKIYNQGRKQEAAFRDAFGNLIYVPFLVLRNVSREDFISWCGEVNGICDPSGVSEFCYEVIFGGQIP